MMSSSDISSASGQRLVLFHNIFTIWHLSNPNRGHTRSIDELTSVSVRISDLFTFGDGSHLISIEHLD